MHWNGGRQLHKGILWTKVLIFQGADPIFDVGSLRFLGALLAMAVILLAGSSNVEASTITLSTSKPTGKDFTKAWEMTRMVYYSGSDIPVGELCYGFDTVLTNEDYVWTRSAFYKHKSALKNDNGSYSSGTSVASTSATWTKLEVKHSGSSPTYKIVFVDVANETASDFTLGTPNTSDEKERHD